MKFKEKNDIDRYIHNQDYVANKYVLKCVFITVVIYFLVFVLNLLNVFTVDDSLMIKSFVMTLFVYLIVRLIVFKLTIFDHRTKYIVLFGSIVMYSIATVYLTYHAFYLAPLTLLYATLYSSKKITRYAYVLTVISVFVTVYCGYFYGLCDANMLLLTVGPMKEYVKDGYIIEMLINDKPTITLFLFFIVPRCLLYYGYMAVCNSIYTVITGSVEKAKHSDDLEKEKNIAVQQIEVKEEEVKLQKGKTEKLFMQTVMALSEAVDAKDRYTSGHSKRVAKYSRMIAQRLGMSDKELDEIYRAGLLHDVGKIRIPAEIINKPGKLTDEEYSLIKIHPITGYHILKGISEDGFIAIAAKYHHERYDGKGYPNGISGEQIPLVARIIGVADSYDAMASNRSYRNALPQKIVREEILKGRGTQFDPRMADIMLQIIDEDKEYSLKQIDSMDRIILTVDDEPYNNAMIEEIMRDEPMYLVMSASNGDEVFDILTKVQVDLILLDVEMPDIDGITLLEEIRKKYDIPVVLVTDANQMTLSSIIENCNCNDFITKPYLPLLVKEVVHNLTEKMRMP